MALVPDERLLHPAVSLHHIYQIIYNPVFQSHHHIEIAKADIRVDQNDLLPHSCQTCSNVCRGGGLSHPAFP